MMETPHQPTAALLLSLPLRPSQRTTASLTPIILLNKLRRSLHSDPVSLRPASQTRAASRTKNGQTLRPLLRMRRKISLLDLAENPNVSASASRSNSSRLISASSSNPNVGDEVVSAAAEVVATDPVAEAMDHSVVDVVMEAEVDADVVMATEEALAQNAEAQEAIPEGQVHLSTPTIPLHFPAWDHRFSTYKAHTIFLGANSLQYVTNE